MWICTNCGYEKYHALPQMATWHAGTCEICGKKDVVITEERDFRFAAAINKLEEMGTDASINDDALDRNNLY